MIAIQQEIDVTLRENNTIKNSEIPLLEQKIDDRRYESISSQNREYIRMLDKEIVQM